MAAFIGRSTELKVLNSVHDSNIRNCYIESVPRAGATSLVRKFCEKHRCLYVTLPEGSPAECLRAFTLAIEKYTGEPPDAGIDTFEAAFRTAKQAIRGDDAIVVFDGCHHAPAEFPSALKDFSDNDDAMIVLIGKGDIDRYGITFTERIELPLMSLEDSIRLHPKMSPVDNLRTYMAVGGYPLYHSLMNKPDFRENVEKNFLGQYPRLCAEAELILRKSSVPYIYCCAILSDIASCIGRPIDIANRENISRQLCDIYLKKLTEEGLIRSLVQIGNSPKKPVYIIANPLIAFYLMAIRMNPALDVPGKGEYKDIDGRIDMFMELRFRDICEDYLRKHFNCVSVGRWWLKDEDTNKPTLAAIIDINGEKRTIIADCKFRSGKIDTGALKAFVSRCELISDVPDKSLMMFSISGFEDKLIKKARAENVVLVGPNELLSGKE